MNIKKILTFIMSLVMCFLLCSCDNLITNKYSDYYKIEMKDILIIHDDLDLELGKIRIKSKSSSGGHNGIKDIIKHLQTNEFLKLRIGISHPENEVIDYVISKFKKEELQIISNKQTTINNIIEDFIEGLSLEELQNKYN